MSDPVKGVIAPGTVEQVQALTDAIVEGRTAFLAFVEDVKSGSVAIQQATQFIQLSKGIDSATQSTENLNEAQQKHAQATEKYNTIIVTTNKETAEYAAEMLRLKSEIKAGTKELDALNLLLARTNADTLAGQREIARLEERIKLLSTSVGTAETKLMGLNDAVKDNAVAVTGSSTAFGNLSGMMERMFIRFITYQTAFALLSKGIEWFTTVIGDASKGITGFERAMNKALDKIDEFKTRTDKFKREALREAGLKDEFGLDVENDPKQMPTYKRLQNELTILEGKQRTNAQSTKEKKEQLEIDQKIYNKKKEMINFEISYYEVLDGNISKQQKAREKEQADKQKLINEAYLTGGDAPLMETDPKESAKYVALAKQRQEFADNIAILEAERAALKLEKKYSHDKKPPKEAATTEINDANKLTKELAQIQADKLKREAEQEKIFSEDYSKTLKERLEHYTNYQHLEYQAQQIMLQAQYDEAAQTYAKIEGLKAKKEAGGKLSSGELGLIDPNNIALQKAKMEEALEKSNQLQVDMQEKLNKGLAELYGKDIQIRLDALTKIAENNKNKQDEEMVSLDNHLKNGTITTEKYKEKEQGIKDKYAIKTREEQKKYLVDQINDSDLVAADKKKLVDEVDKITDAANEAKYKKDLDDADRREKIQKEYYAKITDLASSSLDAIFTIQQNNFAAEEQRLQLRMQAVQLQTQQEIDAVNASTGNQINKQQKLNIIVAEGHSMENQIAAQEKELAIRKAKGDKAAAEASVIESTAMAIMKIWAENAYDPPVAIGLTALVTALGAAQFAAAASTPIPTYALGTENHTGGLARFGEAGPELIKIPGRQPFIADKETIANLPAGTKVKPIRDDIRAFAESGVNNKYMLEAYNMQLLFDGAISKQTIDINNKLDNVTMAIMRNRPLVKVISSKDSNESLKWTGHR